MSEEHRNFEQLLVGHVLGDLSDSDASRFRSHLLGCGDCRSRVAELRGIAADLAEAERDELARARVRTEAPRRVVEPEAARLSTGQRITVRHVTVATVVVVAIAAAMGFWNLHLRTVGASYLAAAEDRRETLETLTAGPGLELELAAGLRGIAVSDEGRVAFSLSGVDDPASGELLVAWFLDGPDGTEPVVLARIGQLSDGTLAATLDDPGGRELVITRESEPGEQPGGPQLLRAELPAR